MVNLRRRIADRYWTRHSLERVVYFSRESRVRRDLPTLLTLANAPPIIAFPQFAWEREVTASVAAGMLVVKSGSLTGWSLHDRAAKPLVQPG